MARSGTKVILSSTLNMTRKSGSGGQEDGKDETEMFRLDSSWGSMLLKARWKEEEGDIRNGCERESGKIGQISIHYFPLILIFEQAKGEIWGSYLRERTLQDNNFDW